MKAPRKRLTITLTLDEINRRFVPLADDPRTRKVRAAAMALAHEWLRDVPDSSAKKDAIDTLALAADLACDAYDDT